MSGTVLGADELKMNNDSFLKEGISHGRGIGRHVNKRLLLCDKCYNLTKSGWDVAIKEGRSSQLHAALCFAPSGAAECFQM